MSAVLFSFLASLSAAAPVTEVSFDAVRITAEAPTPAIALITERRTDSLDVCQQMAQREFFYIEARFHAAEKEEPEHTLAYGDEPVDYLACIYNSASGVWMPLELTSRSHGDDWFLMDTPKRLCRCEEGTVVGEVNAGPLNFLEPGHCEISEECVDARSFIFRAEYGTSSFAVLAPFEPGLERINEDYWSLNAQAPHCTRSALAEHNARLREMNAWCGQVLSTADRQFCQDYERQPPEPPCAATLPPVEVVVDGKGLMLFRTYGASYYERPEAPHFYGVAWIPDRGRDVASY